VEDKIESHSASAKGKKKYVSFVEKAKNVVVRPREPGVRVFKSKFRYKQQMKKIAKAPCRPPFSQSKEH